MGDLRFPLASWREAALVSEALVTGQPVDALSENPGGVARTQTLLGRAVPGADSSPPSALTPILSPDDWKEYRYWRSLVEAEFDADEPEVDALVTEMRARGERCGLRWFFLRIPEPVGAIGLLPFELEGTTYGRFQDVDVFPPYRGQGWGNRLLEEADFLVRQSGVDVLLVKADDDDWPKDWYLRKGFHALVQVRHPRA